MRKAGIFGGTFDPIHHGHLITAQSVREIRNLEKIIFIPSFIPPHKQNQQITSPEHRLEMVKLAVEPVPFFEWSDFEIKAGRVSYTIDTLKEFRKNYDQLEFIIGYDNIFQFHKWKDADEIIKLAQIIVLKRKSSHKPEFIDKYYKAAVFVETRAIEISATDIRNRIRDGLPVYYLTPDKVLNYIEKNNLYKGSSY
ncbi:MAG: nicotinate-nucleotide adenylyltransferase [Ignavibacteriaceae bacterium]